MDDAERYRDLAERVLGRSANGNEVRLLLDEPPPEADGRIRLPGPTRIIGSVVRRDRNGELASLAVHVASPLESAAFLAAERRAYEADGYGPPPPYGAPGGFRPSAMRTMNSGTFCHGEDGPWIQCMSRPSTDGSEGVVVWNAPTAGMGPCAVRSPIGHPMADLLPPLDAPDGVDLMPSGGYGGPAGSWTTGGTAVTALTARQLVDAFAPQLQAAGATKLASGGDETVGWTQWRLAKEPWEAFLVAFGPDRRKELQLRVDRPDRRGREEAMRGAMGWRTWLSG